MMSVGIDYGSQHWHGEQGLFLTLCVKKLYHILNHCGGLSFTWKDAAISVLFMF